MSPLQKRIILTLAIANVLFFLLGMPGALILSNGLLQPREQPPIAMISTIPGGFIPQVTTFPSLTPTRPKPSPVLEVGWKTHNAPAIALAIALPPTWEPQELSQATLDSNIQSLIQKNPWIAETLQEQGQQLIAAGVQFFAADYASGASNGQVITNVTIVHQTWQQELGIDSFVKTSLQLINEMEGATKPASSRRFQTEVGQMAEFRYRMAMSGANGQPLTSAVTQYVFVLGKESYLVTFATPLALETKLAPVFEKIAKSLRWTGPN